MTPLYRDPCFTFRFADDRITLRLLFEANQNRRLCL